MFTGGTIRRLQMLSFQASGKATDPVHEPAAAGSQITQAAIQALLSARRVREQQFGYDLFGEPAWDILLGALAAHLGQKRMFVSDLNLGEGICPSIAARWIRKLQQDGWLIGRDDGRGQALELTPQGFERLKRYFEAILPGLPAF